MKKFTKTPFAAAIGVAVISSVAATAAQAEANPFGITELSSGYMQVAEMACGAAMGMDKPAKTAEGACAGAKKTEAKAEEGKCGEGKCGAMMEGCKMKKGMESACGAMMKGKEGACGAMAGGNKDCPHAKDKEGADKADPAKADPAPGHAEPAKTPAPAAH